MQSGAQEVYLGLKTPSNGRPHVVDWNDDVSLHTHAQLENYLTLLDPVLSGHAVGGRQNVDVTLTVSDMNARSFATTWSTVTLPHPLVLLRRGEDLCLSEEDVAEGPTAAALLVEAGNRSYGEALDHQGLGVW